MEDVTKALKIAYKPYDIVSTRAGDVGFIKEININACQPELRDQISYSVEWLYEVGQPFNAWWNHDQLTKHCNFFEKIAEASCHPFGHGKEYVSRLMNLGIREKSS